MRLATYNIEWFDALFDDDGVLHDDSGWSARYKVSRAEQTTAIARVLTAVDADAIMIIEAPDTSKKRSTTKALSYFAERFSLRTNAVATGFVNDTQQEIALLYDPAVLTARHDPQESANAPRFDTAFHIDLDIDATRDRVVFSKPPLELKVETTNGSVLRMIGSHLKSKAPHGATDRDEVMRFAIANRRKQLAQAIWLRARIDAHLEAGDSLIVLGDLNDGPGLDEYENLFGRSSVEIVLGEGPQALFDPHAEQALARKLGAQPSSARFYLTGEKRYMQALLDYVMVSQDLRSKSPRWRIWHPFEDPECWRDQALRDALLTASDHFPVVLDIDV
ncbi:endonuclease/exonuclease/phosphatase family protein [Thalassococcus lentus]|uniref:Endonuclease/exonuclease/phosphatase family protein n=1 Tax=Thalassococcus lentus TaxID=1210524 RepID=A0ABT4XVD5_9RHOB|nr:endonuclease/exonuclease/phosphatase family protein [Thalassococcus lentus]MDA7425896.1 endonuclease/exonuclease/phosphatase family protein [Thalassococcus lentus]